MVDEQKVVPRLRAPVPVEILPFAFTPVLAQLRALGCRPVVREGVRKDGPVITDNGNFIADCTFNSITDPALLETEIAKIAGVVESGLFTGFAEKTTVIVGNEKECKIIP